MTRTTLRPPATIRTGRPVRVLPEIEDVTRRQFLIGAAGLVLLPAGCGGGEEGEAPGETLAVRHRLGTTEVPSRPRRVFCVEARGMLEIALALDLPTIAAGTYEDEPFPPAVSELAREAGVEPLSISGEGPSLEAVARLEPDLILGPTYLVESAYEQYAQIAPTLALPTNQDEPWAETLRRLAEEFGREDQAAGPIGEYEDERERLREKWGERLETVTVSIFYAGTDGVYVYGDSSLIYQTLRDLGGVTPEGYDPEGRDISPERIDLLDADVLLRLSFGEEYDLDLSENALYQKLPAVAAGRVVTVEGTTANIGGVFSAIECLRILDEAYELASRGGASET
jgi:iron complex transport system substrate-binding protein